MKAKILKSKGKVSIGNDMQLSPFIISKGDNQKIVLEVKSTYYSLKKQEKQQVLIKILGWCTSEYEKLDIKGD